MYSAKTTNAPFTTVELLVVISRVKMSDSLVQQGEFRKTASHSARLPVMTCLDALLSS